MESMKILLGAAAGIGTAWLAMAGSATADDLSIEAVHAATPSEANPLEMPRDDRENRDLWQRKVRWYHSIPAEEVVAHPEAASFPGEVAKGADRVSRSVSIDPATPRWHSTGLYAPPGEVVTIRLPEAAAKLGWKARIGCHSDNISRQQKWTRFPVISRQFALDAPEVRIANGFGGLIYIEVPRIEERGGFRVQTYGGYGWIHETVPSLDAVDIEIAGAVAAPLFRLGESDPEAWLAEIGKMDVPWGEIAGRHLIISLPKNELQSVKDPVAVAEFWDAVQDACWEFAGWPGERTVAERFVFDRQISAGWMHSGYPIMAHLVSAKHAVDLERLRSQGDWGFFHELGHNHQGRAYTFNSFVEVTVNLHTLYIMEKICGLSPSEARRNFRDVDAVLHSRLVENKRGPFEELALYLPLIEKFGYQSLTRAFQTYLSPEGSHGLLGRNEESEALRRSEWLRRYSEAVGHDTSAYFALFDIHGTPETIKSLANLPKFMPTEGVFATLSENHRNPGQD